MSSLFVYGTLAPGKPNHHELEMIDGDWQQATITGHLVEQEWGASMGYPAIVPCETGDKVKGYVLTASELSKHWPRLDAFEGEGYERVLVNAELGSGELLPVYVYAVKKA